MADLKKENETFVGGVRLWKTETLSREPVGAEKDTDIGKLWLLFLELVGHEVDNAIQKLEVVNIDADVKECECDAALEEDKTKSKHPCSCDGSGAIVTFRSALAAGKLKKQLNDHKNWHSQGYSDQGRRLSDGSVEFCQQCCFKNKQLKNINKRPVAGKSIFERNTESEFLSNATTNEQIRAFEMILISVLGVWAMDFIAVVKEAIKDMNLGDARAQVLKSVHDILEEPENQDDIPVGRTKEMLEKVIKKAVDDHIAKKTDGVNLKEVKEWTKKYQAQPELVTIEEEEEVTHQVPPPPPSTAPPIAETKDATEENLKEAMQAVKREVDTSKSLTMMAGMEDLAKSLMARLKNKIVIMQQIYSDMKSEEADKHKDEFSAQSKSGTEALATVIRVIKFMEFESGASTTSSKTSSKDYEEDVPDDDEVRGAISLFGRFQLSFNEGKQEVKDLLETEDQQVKRVDFEVISKQVSPSIEKTLEKMARSADQFKKWRKLKNPGLSEEFKRSLNMCIVKANTAQEEWHTMGLALSRLDRQQQLSRKAFESGAAKLLTQQKIETFFGEENGKKWQNIFEWCQQIELQIITVFHDKKMQVNQVINHLSPKIAALAKVEEFESYDVLKDWLMQNYVDEYKIVREWQNKIGSFKPSKWEEVRAFVSHTQGVLAHIKEYCHEKSSLRNRLFSDKNISSLTKYILDTLSAATKNDEYSTFIKESWTEEEIDKCYKGEEVKPEQQLKKMETYLSKVMKVAKMRVDFNVKRNQSEIGGPKDPASNETRGGYKQRYKGQNRNGGAEGNTKGGIHSNSVNYALVAIGCKNKPNAVDLMLVTTGKKSTSKEWNKYKSERNVFGVQIDLKNELQKAENKEQEYERSKIGLPCFMDGKHGCKFKTPHEMYNCREIAKFDNIKRFKAARDKNAGPGVQCFTCLSSVCFLKRTQEVAESGDKNKALAPCLNYDKVKDVLCIGCAEELKKDPNAGKGQKAMHAVVCPKKEHKDRTGDVKRMMGAVKRHYNHRDEIQIHHVIGVDADDITSVNNADKSDWDKGAWEDVEENTKKLLKEKFDSYPKPTEVSVEQYKGASESVLFDTIEGKKQELNMSNKNIRKRIKRASKGFALYFMQQFNLNGKNVLVFYDSGAMMNLIETALARELNLKMTTRQSMYVIGAGNKVHSSGDGRYELILRGTTGEIYVLEVCGSKELTNKMMQADFTDVHEKVRNKAIGMEKDGKRCGMNPNEILPAQVAGMAVKLIIGMPIPTLQPEVIFSLPSGLLVARVKLKDRYGSRIVFGGMFDDYKTHFNMYYAYKMSPNELNDYTQYHRACVEEYHHFRDSLRVDRVFFKNGRETNEAWSEVIERETDAMVEEAPVIIAGSEEKRGVQLHKLQVLKQLINAGVDIQRQTEVHKVVEPVVTEESVHSEECIMNPAVSGGMYNLRLADERKFEFQMKNLCPFNEGAVGEVYGNNILLESSQPVNATYAKIDDLVNYSFGIDKSDTTSREGVYFDNVADKVKYLNNIMPDFELEELMKRESSVKTELSTVVYTENMVNLSGLAKLPDQEDKTMVQPNEECRLEHGCQCDGWKEEDLLEEAEDGITNVDAKQWQKLKKALRKWEDDETVGTGIDFRCSKCLKCKDCLRSGKTRARSQREEDEQRVIESSVRIDWEKKQCFVFLPWIKSPQELAVKWGSRSNLKQAMHFLKKMLAKTQEDRDSLTRFWEELKSRDVVRRLKDLDEGVQKNIMSSPVIHYYPWNCVFKESITTPCRMVVDSRTSGLNDHLAKGLNTLNNLQQLLLRFRSYEHIGSYDISKMYNMLFIEPSHLQYQLILWVDEMNPKNEPEVWVMMRAIYGTISSGNQAEVAIRRGATVLQDQYPEGAHTIINETYVDDGVPCRDDPDSLKVALQEVEIILNKIGFGLKCTTVSGQQTELSKKASSDGESIGIAGYKYYPRDDLLSLAFKECNFNPVKRGMKAPNKHPVVTGEDIDSEIFPAKLTRAQAVGKLAEMYDLTGVFMPICMIGKILARKISHLDWADYVPDEMLKDWLEIVKKIQNVRHIKIRRCVIPKNAKNPKEVDIMEVHDGSQHSSATAVYVRCELDDGSFSTKMLFSRSSLCPVDQCIPRNELQSCHLGATASFITKVALKGKVQKIYTFGDSMVALLWVVNKDLKLKSWAFARVQDIHRLVETAEHYWIKGIDNIADKATKGQVTVEDVENESSWQNGFPWMHTSIDAMKSSGTILDFDQVMKSLNAKDRQILAEEQNPTLPDLATGARRNSNPEFDIMYSTPSLRDDNIMSMLLSYCEKIDNGEKSSNKYGVNKGDILVLNQKAEDELSYVASNEVGLSNQLYAASFFGVDAEMVQQFHVNYPPNFSCLPSGKPRVVEKDSQIRRFPVDIVRYGWKKTYKTTSIAIHWLRMAKHRTHQIPVEGHHLYEDYMGGDPKTEFWKKVGKLNIEVRKNLEKSCKICHKESKISTEGVNMGYLDSLCSGEEARVTRDDQLLRKEGDHDWLPKWKSGVDKEIFNYCYEVRSKTRSGWDGVPRKSTKPMKPKKTQAKACEIRIDDEVKAQTWMYFMRKASEKVTEELSNKDKEKFVFDEDEKIWKYWGRLLERREIEVRDYEFDYFYDSNSITFVHPVGLATDPLIFQILLHFHWSVFAHKGTGSTNRIIAQFLYIIKGGYVVKAIRDGCQRCRRILKKQIKTKMGDVPIEKLAIAPAFSYLQADTAGPFPAFSRHNQRSTIEVNCLVLICIVTGAVSLWALETLEAPSIVKAMLRHSARYGYPVTAFTDKGPGLKKGLTMRVDITDYGTLIKRELGMNVIPKPTHSHEARGKVERVIRVLKNYLEDRKLERLKQSILDWESSFAFVANYLNNLPMSRLSRNRSMSYDVTEIITANRLLLGRNNFRSLSHVLEEEGVTYNDRLSRNNMINKSWQTLLQRLIPDLTERPKWHKSGSIQPEVGDYVIFCHKESRAGPEHAEWKVGLVIKIEESESSPSTSKYYLEYRQVIKQKNKKPEDWKVATQVTDRHMRDLVLLFTEAELKSLPGSEEHLRRLTAAPAGVKNSTRKIRFSTKEVAIFEPENWKLMKNPPVKI